MKEHKRIQIGLQQVERATSRDNNKLLRGKDIFGVLLTGNGNNLFFCPPIVFDKLLGTPGQSLVIIASPLKGNRRLLISTAAGRRNGRVL